MTTIYIGLAILAVFGFGAWKLYSSGASNRSIKIERDTLEENLGVEHAIREELIKSKEKQKKELDIISHDFESARNLWLRDNSDSSDS